MTRLLLGAAIAVLVAAFVGRAADVISEDALDALALAGFALLAAGQALRAWADRSRRSLLILLLVLALGAVVLLD